MCVHGVRSKMKPEGVSEAKSTEARAFSAIAEPQPEGVRDAFVKAGDRAAFVSLGLEKQSAPSKGALTR